MEFTSQPYESAVSVDRQTKERPQRIFWFEPEYGEPFCCNEEEAWNILKGRIKVMEGTAMVRKKYTYLGASNSIEYYRGLKEVQKIHREKGLEASQEYLRELYAKEMTMADKTIRPRNMDKLDINGNPINLDALMSGL